MVVCRKFAVGVASSRSLTSIVAAKLTMAHSLLSHRRRTHAVMERYHVTVTGHVATLDITIDLLPPHIT
uniref:Secreted protein n=1 Tax=Parascaris univalens TaxID=6257 RepID=A0A915BU14_PARUN